MEPVERTRGDGEEMHASVRREHFERLQEEGRVPRHGGDRGRARRAGADEEDTTLGNHLEPQYEPQPQMEIKIEHQMKDDDEARESGDDEQQQ